MEYSIRKRVEGTFEDAVANTKASLADAGFGILTEIDVKETMKKKLDVEYDNYLILGACNPPLAHRALQAEKEIGLFLPCNVIVYESDGSVYVAAVMPTAAMNMIENSQLSEVANEAEAKLRGAIEVL